ncbi:ATP-binding protein [Serratia marcescens]|uniref:ATP-binding protein n=1 Tax=Serratia marcescens TaxID=615 RepID=UPI002DBDE0A7|nr:ATP-binding protein [Serratia marcescens]MEB6083545.1 ATP-binding protein [Serratia marcescens]
MDAKVLENQNLTADFQPSKRFFVSMLTRDIELNDAILDLLDNCVDGAIRTNNSKDNNKPYAGFKADLQITQNSFTISDNCGGIAKSDRDYAFKMGRPLRDDDEDEGTVGVYGIGMKRAIFKMGTRCNISSNHPDGAFEVDITPEWISSDAWTIPITENSYIPEDNGGTKIRITNLHSNISQKFSEESYLTDLHDQIKHSLSYIIQKGFTITLNGTAIRANPIKLISDENDIEPFIYRADIEGVKIDLAVGFYKSLEDDEDDATVKRSAENAGWTVICNDRVVLYCDKTHLTGWGLEPVPRFHTQFISISGVVRFTCKDPEKLPITTTKRGVDLSSVLYNDVRNKMIEGMLIFIRFTNQWKGENLESGKKILSKAQPVNAQDFLNKDIENYKSGKGTWSHPNRNPNELKFIPKLPTPKIMKTKVRIVFTREITEVKSLAEYFFGDENYSPSEVGNKCFETVINEVV